MCVSMYMYVCVHVYIHICGTRRRVLEYLDVGEGATAEQPQSDGSREVVRSPVAFVLEVQGVH